MGSRLLTLLLTAACVTGLQGAHIIGGEIYYDHLGNNNYQVHLKLYRDCGPGITGFDANVTIGIFNANGGLHSTLSIPFPGEIQIPIVVGNPCLQAPPNLCIATTTYSTVVSLPPTPGGYTLTYQRCCRVPAILNLVNPGAQGLTCTVKIPGTPNSQNSSARFDNYPPIVLCVGEQLVFDHGASDPDGDELVYELCTPYHGGSQFDPAPFPAAPPYAFVPWAAGYNVNNQINSNPAMTVNADNGILTVTPTQIGFYAVGVCVKEYRNGVLLSEGRRDFMFVVVVCDANIVSVVAGQPSGAACLGLTQTFGNNSVNGQFFFWDFGDPTTLADTSNLATPTYTYPAPGSYTVTLIANPGWPCADTSTSVYSVFLPLDPVFEPPEALCGASMTELTATGNFTGAATVTWNLGPTATPSMAQGAIVDVTFQPIGTQDVTVTVSENGCTESFTGQVSVFPIPVAAIGEQTTFCTGLTMQFTNESQGASGYLWDFGDPSSANDNSTATNPNWTYGQTGTYTVTLTADPNGPCPNSTTAVFDVYTDIPISFAEPPIACPGQPVVFTAQGNFGAGTQFVWNFGSGMPAAGTGVTASSSFAEVGVHEVTVDVEANGCEGSYTGTVEIHPFPVADFTSESQACVGAWFAFTDLSEALTPMAYLWDFGDGNTSTASDPVHQYQAPGSYTVTLTVNTTMGCIASDTRIRPDQVVVYPNPIAAFTALPNEVSVFDPVVSIEDFAYDAVSWYYTVDGQTYNSPTFTHFFSDGGQYEIWQYVVSPNGCPDSTLRMVYVSDHIFWAPNAFTPDDDEVNEVWLPTVIGARFYELMIHDRWGRLVFSTDDPKQGWNGADHPQGVYVYTARIKEWGAYSKEYQGHFSLLR
ncbi:MAG: PKD domain-containing protein [Flavobacteriales bacterium]|nr:PKD domain-containing protein [Flavobacteriales bacterium]